MTPPDRHRERPTAVWRSTCQGLKAAKAHWIAASKQKFLLAMTFGKICRVATSAFSCNDNQLLAGQGFIPKGFHSGVTKAALFVFFIIGIVAFKPHYVAIALKGQKVRGQAI